MEEEKKHNIPEKTRLHPKNRNRENYDIEALLKTNPELSDFIKPNKYGDNSVDFKDPKAVKTLNRSLLNHYYGIEHWDFPDENLCPPIPGRADYIHHIAGLLGEDKNSPKPRGEKITCYDIGVGASCIYPIIGVVEYGWNFIASDTDEKSIESAKNIVSSNPQLNNKIECKLQEDDNNIFTGIIGENDKIDLSICNPPFHSSVKEAQRGSKRKIKNLTGKEVETADLNFSGINSELIYEGGEYMFINKMVKESEKYAQNFYWFSTLVSKKANLQRIYKLLDRTKVNQIVTLPMGTGNKSSRIVVWSFLTQREQEDWRRDRW